MFRTSFRTRSVVLFTLIAAVAVFASVRFGPFARADAEPATAALVPIIAATNNDALVADVDIDGRADPGDTLEYTVTVSNTGAGATDATAVIYNSTLTSDLTLVAGTVHASPIAGNDTYNWVGNTFLDTNARALPTVTVNDIAVNGTGGTDTFNVTPIAGGATTLGGTVTLAATGHFTYTPPLGRPNLADGASVNDSFTYTITNSAAPTLTGTGTVTIALTGRVWYLQAGAAGDGRSNTPSSSPSAMSTAADKSTDVFYVFSNAASLNGPFAVDAGQQLLGQGVNLVVSSITLFTAGAPTPTTTNTAGSCVSLSGAPGNNTLSGFNIGNCTGGTAITGANVGTLNVATMTINTNGGALDLTGVGTPTVSVVLGGTTSTGGARNVSLVGLNGTVTLAGGALSGATGNGLHMDGGNAGLTFSGTISNTGGRQVNIINKTGGTVALSGAIGGTGTGIFMNANNGATMNFSGGIALSTGTNAAFTATGGGTVNATQNNTTIVNTLTTTTGTALNVSGGTQIGASDLTFRSISAGTAAGTTGVGINLDATGALGGLHVTGNGAADTGGTIRFKGTGATTNGSVTDGVGINLNDTDEVELNWMQLNDHTNYAIRGNAVIDLRLNELDITGFNGSEANGTTQEYAVNLTNVTGTVNIINTEVSGGFLGNVRLDNSSGTTNLNFLNNNVHNTRDDPLTSGDGFNLEADTTAILVANVSNNIFNNNEGDDFNLSLINSATVDLTCNNNDIDGDPNKLSAGIFILGASYNGIFKYDISGNNVQGANQGAAIFVNKGSGTATYSGQIVNNIVGNPAVNHSGALESQGMHASARGAGGSHKTLINNNQIYQYHDRGIVLEAGEGAPSFTATVTNNTVSNFADATNSLHGIHFDYGILSTDNAQVTIDVRNNLIANAGNEPQGGVDFRMRTAGSNDVFIGGCATCAGSAANTQTFIDGQNLDGTSFSVSLVGGGGPPIATYNNGPAVPFSPPNLPILPPAPIANPAEERVSARAISGDLWVSTNDLLAVLSAERGVRSAEGESAPVLSQSATAESQSAPVLSQSASAESQSAPVLSQSAPAESQSAPVLSQSATAESQSAPVLSQSASVINESAPVISQSASAEGQSASVLNEPGTLGHGAWDILARLGEMISPTVYAEPVSGELVSVGGAGFTLPGGKTITIRYRATIDAPPPFLTSVSNQGTVSGSNFANVLTDDPSIGGAANPTLTIVDSTTVTVSSSQNPSLTGQPVTLTATLTGAPVHATGDPGGTVEFFEDGNSLGAPVAVAAGVLNDNTGTASITTSTIPSGSNVITAVFSGGGTGPGGFNANSSATTGGTNVTQVVGNVATWDGSSSANWHDAANWSTNFAPTAAHDVVLPAGAMAFSVPTITTATGDVTVNSLVINTGRALTITNSRTLTITSSMTMSGGNVDSSAAGETGTLVIDDGATLTRISGIVNEPITIRKEFTAGARSGDKGDVPQAVFVFPVGTATGFSPLTANVTGDGSLTVKVTGGTIAPLADATTLDRYWTLSETGALTADLTFQYLPGDVDGTESTYRLIRVTGGSAVATPNGVPCPGAGNPCVDTGADTIFAGGVQAFDSNWTAGQPLPPTAANVGVSGRVFNSTGRGVAGAIVRMTDQGGNIVHAVSNPFGYYRFEGIASGQDYVMTVTSKRYTFAARLVSVSDNVTNLDFIAEP